MIDDYSTHLMEEVKAGRLSRRELIRRGSVYGLSFGAIGMLLAACGADPKKAGGAGQPTTSGPGALRAFRAGGTLRIGTVVPAGDLEPLTINDDGTTYTTQTALEFLCFPRPDLTLEPRLATEWKPGSTPQEWTFKLREGVVWHDGSAFTADDVVASFRTYADPKGTASAVSSFAGILSKGGVEKVDEHTVRFHLDRPYSDFPYLVSALNYTVPVLPKNYQPGDFRKGGVGTGAYVLKSYAPKQSATFVRNDKYWGGKPHLDGITIKYFAEPAPLVLALQGDALDVALQITNRDAQQLRAKPEIQVFQTSGSAYRPIHLRVDRAPFDDKRVRQAIALGVDRNALIKQLLGGTGDLGNDHAFAPVFPTSPDARAVPQRALDVARAKQLLADAGHGGGLHVELTTLQYQDIPQLAVLLKEQLRAIGVDVSLKLMTETAYLGSGDNQPWLQVPMGIVYWADRGSASQLIAPAYLSDSPWNSAHWKNPAFDKLIADFDGEVDEGKRKQLASRAAKLMQDETPAVIPYWLKGLRAVKQGVQGIAPGPTVVFEPSKAGFAA